MRLKLTLRKKIGKMLVLRLVRFLNTFVRHRSKTRTGTDIKLNFRFQSRNYPQDPCNLIFMRAPLK